MRAEARVIAIDFDGPIHKYREGWKDGSIYDEPVEGAIAALQKLIDDGYEVVIFTARANEPEHKDAVINWLTDQMKNQGYGSYGFPFKVTAQKPNAIAYIDDRGIRFTDWPDMLKYFI